MVLQKVNYPFWLNCPSVICQTVDKIINICVVCILKKFIREFKKG